MSHAHANILHLDNSFQLLIDFICDETDADVCFYSAFCKVKHRTHVQRALRYAERTLNDPESVIFRNYLLCFKIRIRNVTLQPVPCAILCNLGLADDDLDILAYLKKLVVSPSVDLLLGYMSALVSFAEPFYAPVSVVGVFPCTFF